MEDLCKQLNHRLKEQDSYLEVFKHFLDYTLNEAKLFKSGHINQCKSRQKSADSLARKLLDIKIKKSQLPKFEKSDLLSMSFETILENVHDLVASRLIVLTPKSIPIINEYILEKKDHFDIQQIKFYSDGSNQYITQAQQDSENLINRTGRDIKILPSKKTSGYSSIHYICNVRKDFNLPKNFQFELQLRTIVQEAWSEVQHATIYKAEASKVEDLLLQFADHARVLDVADLFFARHHPETKSVFVDNSYPLDSRSFEVDDKKIAKKYRLIYRSLKNINLSHSGQIKAEFISTLNTAMEKHKRAITSIINDKTVFYERLEVAFSYYLMDQYDAALPIYLSCYSDEKHKKEPRLLTRYCSTLLKVNKRREADKIADELFDEITTKTIQHKKDIGVEESKIISAAAVIFWEIEHFKQAYLTIKHVYLFDKNGTEHRQFVIKLNYVFGFMEHFFNNKEEFNNDILKEFLELEEHIKNWFIFSKKHEPTSQEKRLDTDLVDTCACYYYHQARLAFEEFKKSDSKESDSLKSAKIYSEKAHSLSLRIMHHVQEFKCTKEDFEYFEQQQKKASLLDEELKIAGVFNG